MVKLKLMPNMKSQPKNSPDLLREPAHPKDTPLPLEKKTSMSQSLERSKSHFSIRQPLKVLLLTFIKLPTDHVVKLKLMPNTKSQLKNSPDLLREPAHPKDTLLPLEKKTSMSQSLERSKSHFSIRQPSQVLLLIFIKSPTVNAVKLKLMPNTKSQLKNLPDLPKEPAHPKDTPLPMEKKTSKSQSLEISKSLYSKKLVIPNPITNMV